MSSSTLPTDRTARETTPRVIDAIASVTAVLSDRVRAAGFWSAIALPFVYLPLVIDGLETVDGSLLFAGLVALHLVSLFVGRGHGRD